MAELGYFKFLERSFSALKNPIVLGLAGICLLIMIITTILYIIYYAPIFMPHGKIPLNAYNMYGTAPVIFIIMMLLSIINSIALVCYTFSLYCNGVRNDVNLVKVIISALMHGILSLILAILIALIIFAVITFLVLPILFGLFAGSQNGVALFAIAYMISLILAALVFVVLFNFGLYFINRLVTSYLSVDRISEIDISKVFSLSKLLWYLLISVVIFVLVFGFAIVLSIISLFLIFIPIVGQIILTIIQLIFSLLIYPLIFLSLVYFSSSDLIPSEN